MSSKRFKKLPEKTLELPSEMIEKLLPVIKKNCTTKFDESVDLSFQINNKQKKSEINIRTVVNLPGGTGKKIKVAVVCEDTKSDEAKSAGADASLSVTPYYNKPTQEGLFQHYTQIADQVEFPQVLYNVPGRTSCDLLPETIARLAPHENILGIKEATGDLSRLEKLKKLISDETFFLYSGDDATATDFILNGGHGNISVTANVVPDLMSKLCDFALEKSSEAKAIENKISNLNEMLFLESNPIPVKWALSRMGLIDIGIRLPLTNFSKEHQQTLQEELLKLELI